MWGSTLDLQDSNLVDPRAVRVKGKIGRYYYYTQMANHFLALTVIQNIMSKLFIFHSTKRRIKIEN